MRWPEMATRDVVKAFRAELYARMANKGISSDDLDASLKGNPRAYGVQALNLINTSVNTPGRFRFHKECPPAGAFDGVNRTFSLAGAVLGRNIGVDHVTQSTGALVPLTLTDNPNPTAGTFYLDTVNGAIIVGMPPAASDTISVTYQTKR